MQIQNSRRPVRSLDNSAGLLQYSHDVTTLHVFQSRESGRCWAGIWSRFRFRRSFRSLGEDSARRNRSKIRFQLENRLLAQNNCSLDDILQFSNVPGPGVAGDPVHRVLGYSFDVLAELLRVVEHKERREFRDIRAPLAQRGYLNGKDVQTVKKVGAETAGPDGLLQGSVCSSDNPHVHAHRLAAAHRLELTLLENAQ